MVSNAGVVMSTTFSILIVDDSEDDILLMREALGSTSLAPRLFEAYSADDAEEFLRTADEPVDLILLDINMPPGRSGLEFLREMRGNPSLDSIPVVMMTTSALDSDINRAFENGACAYITKPLDFKELQAVAERLSAYWSKAGADRSGSQMNRLTG